jgi:hypothetical protein
MELLLGDLLGVFSLLYPTGHLLGSLIQYNQFWLSFHIPPGDLRSSRKYLGLAKGSKR